jgi:hypothetical protein
VTRNQSLLYFFRAMHDARCAVAQEPMSAWLPSCGVGRASACSAEALPPALSSALRAGGHRCWRK